LDGLNANRISVSGETSFAKFDRQKRFQIGVSDSFGTNRAKLKMVSSETLNRIHISKVDPYKFQRILDSRRIQFAVFKSSG